MSRLILLSIFLAVHISALANHFTGAQMRYEYIGSPMIFKIELTLYKTCETGAIDLPTFINVFAESKQHGIVINKNLPRTTNDTLKPYCPGTITSCTNISSLYPGYIAAIYTDTIKIPVMSPDWNFVFSNSSRNLGITNLQGASGQSFYIDAPPSIAYLNTSAKLPDYPPHVLFINDSLKIPLTASDADGDSIAYNFLQPASGALSPIPYSTGHSSSLPFGTGGLCYIDADNNMVLKSTKLGKYTITLKINEYRNGGFVGYTMRDFIVICTGTVPGDIVTVPQPVNKRNFITYTCPGRNNVLMFNYTDPNPSDSVYLNIVAPQLPGWTFNITNASGIGSAAANITWTTPPSFNPATLPFFNIVVNTRDNSCNLIGKATYVYKVMTRDCSADSVWPGDANADKVVDLYDPLAIALTYADTGAIRTNATTNWVGENCDFWDGVFLNNIDKKHADCNGDGIVDTADIAAIKLNYGKVHAKPGRPLQKSTAVPDLYFDHAGIAASPDSTVSVKILLGSSTSPVTDLYGLATSIQVDGLALATPPTITYANSWLGNGSNTLSFIKDVTPTSIDWAYARTNHQNVNGQGIIAHLEFKIPATTPNGKLVTLSYSNTRFIDNEGVDIIDVNTMQDTFYVWEPVAITHINYGVQNVRLYPNPSGNDVAINLYAQHKQQLTINITDIAGRLLTTQTVNAQKGHNTFPLSFTELATGMYLVNIKPETAGETTVIKWLKQ